MSLLLLMSSGGASPTAYTLTCSAGSYTIAGQSAVLKRGFTLTCSSEAYVISGQSAILKKTYLLTCQTGAYAIAGQNAILTKNYILVCQAGAYIIAGQSATLTKASVLTCQPGAYVIAGQSASLPRGYVLTCEAGAYTITGNHAVLTNHDVRGLVMRSDRPLKTKRKAGRVPAAVGQRTETVPAPEPKRTTRRIAVVKNVPTTLPEPPATPPKEIPIHVAGTARFWGVANVQVNVFTSHTGTAYFGGQADLTVNTRLNAIGEARFCGEARIRVVPNDDDEAIALALYLLNS